MSNNSEPRRRTYPGRRKKDDDNNKNKTEKIAAGGHQRHPKNTSGNKVSENTQTPSAPRQRKRMINPIEAARRQKERKIISAAAVTIILILAISIALIARACGVRENTNDFVVLMSSKQTVSYDDTVRNGKLYINATALAEFCELTMSGSYDALKLSSQSGDYAVFSPNSQNARVNGSDISLPAPAVIENGTLWLPIDFITSTFRGVTVAVDREKNKITVTRTEAEGSTKEKRIYVPVTFSAATGQTGGSDAVLSMISSYVFKTDISKYSSYLSPADSKYLLLVNKSNPLGESYKPDNLEPINAAYVNPNISEEILLELYAKNALEALMQEMRAAGYKDIYITSGYRTYAKQSQLFNFYISEEINKNPSLTVGQAEQIVLGYSARPGTSEHQSGLCVDFIGEKMTTLDESFADLPAYGWLLDNAHKFGFILRYPEDKTAITGYNFEPWHFRFVGQYHAAAMKLSGLCFEEYLGTLK